jgi:hypothetical protein
MTGPARRAPHATALPAWGRLREGDQAQPRWLRQLLEVGISLGGQARRAGWPIPAGIPVWSWSPSGKVIALFRSIRAKRSWHLLKWLANSWLTRVLALTRDSWATSHLAEQPALIYWVATGWYRTFTAAEGSSLLSSSSRTGAPPGLVQQPDPVAEQHRCDVQVDLVDQSTLKELSADRG